MGVAVASRGAARRARDPVSRACLLQPPRIVTSASRGLDLGRPRTGARGAIVRSQRPDSVGRGGMGATRCVTPRQACPRPNGFGRNLRSKTRWFTGFCNSHQVSHFATFFIDARAEISVAESRFDIVMKSDTQPVRAPLAGLAGARLFVKDSLAHSAPIFVCTPAEDDGPRARSESRNQGDQRTRAAATPRDSRDVCGIGSRVVLLACRFRQ